VVVVSELNKMGMMGLDVGSSMEVRQEKRNQKFIKNSNQIIIRV